MTENKSIFNLQISPFKQVLVAIGLLLIVFTIIKLIAVKISEFDPAFYWEASFTILLLYMLFNAIWSISYKKKTLYLLHSVIGYLFLAVSTALLSQFFSKLSMDEAGAFRMLYLIFTICYLIFLGIVNAMRKILEIVKKQDARLRGEE